MLSTNPGPPMYIKIKQMERIRLAFDGDPVAGISSSLDALVLLLSTILMGHWPTIADPYSSVVGQKGMFALLQLVYALVYTQEIQEEAVFFTWTRLNIRSCCLYLVSHLLVLPDLPIWLAASSHLKLLLSDLWRFWLFTPGIYRMLMW